MVSINIVEVPSRNLERALAFYARVFDLELEISEIDDQRMVLLSARTTPTVRPISITEGGDYGAER